MPNVLIKNSVATVEVPYPKKKCALWHITSRCNSNCIYCYGTFDGSSYLEQNAMAREASFEDICKGIAFLAQEGLKVVHVCGGEPFLRDDIEGIITQFNNHSIDVCLLSNFSFWPQSIDTMLKKGMIKMISASIDSNIVEVNNKTRLYGDKALANINHVLELRTKYSLTYKVGIYSVLTKYNLKYAYALIDWAIEKGIDYITLQPVYLPDNHPKFNDLSIDKSLYPDLSKIFDYLNAQKDKIQSTGQVMQKIISMQYLGDNNTAYNCFGLKGLYYFIDGEGTIKSCPVRKEVLGKIQNLELVQNIQAISICNELCMDCIGSWEIMYPEERK